MPDVKADDDDLVVALEGGEEDFGPPERVEIEPAKPEAQLSPTVPADDDDILGLNDDEDTTELNPDARAKAPAEEAVDTSNDYYDDRDDQIAQRDEQLRQLNAQRIWEQAQSQAEVAETRIQAARVGLNTLNERMQLAQQAMAQAVEAQDVAAQMQIAQDLQGMQSLKGEIENGLRSTATKDQILAQGRQQAQAALAQSQPRGRVVGAGLESRNPLADRWSASNPWTRTHKGANAYLIQQSQKMAASGTWDPDSPSFYAELGKRVKLAYPELNVRPIQAAAKAPGRGQMRGPAAPARSAGAGGHQIVNGKRQYTLTKYDQGAMRRMNLDPGKPEHRKAFARSRMESARERAQNG
jgi:hypothetical protein